MTAFAVHPLRPPHDRHPRDRRIRCARASPSAMDGARRTPVNRAVDPDRDHR